MEFKFLVLAAGKGSRLGADIPKALVPVGGKPILQHLLESIKDSGVDGDPIVVIGHEREHICDTFGAACSYVVQEQQLGTGHAVKIAQKAVGDADALIVLYGDHPFISKQTLRSLAHLHESSGGVLTVMTTQVPTFEGWYKAFLHWGRIVRDGEGKMIGNRQFKDATDEEKKILEVDPALYCFDTQWLWDHINNLEPANAQQELYLTDLVALAVSQGHVISSLTIPPEEAIGINTQEELEIAEGILKTYDKT